MDGAGDAVATTSTDGSGAPGPAVAGAHPAKAMATPAATNTGIFLTTHHPNTFDNTWLLQVSKAAQWSGIPMAEP
ncbi:hypothetical protein AL755_15540 [Arthrobacter sp. ERGS1:01]|nr:hypothetical protein AL755_15540 [Arthrobacter sp. ERGS1:01]